MSQQLFAKAEADYMARCVTNFLASTDASWDTEFSYRDFAEWIDHILDTDDLYYQILRIFKGNFTVNGINALIEDGYIREQRGDRVGITYLTVTDSFVQTVRRAIDPTS